MYRGEILVKEINEGNRQTDSNRQRQVEREREVKSGLVLERVSAGIQLQGSLYVELSREMGSWGKPTEHHAIPLIQWIRRALAACCRRSADGLLGIT